MPTPKAGPWQNGSIQFTIGKQKQPWFWFNAKNQNMFNLNPHTHTLRHLNMNCMVVAESWHDLGCYQRLWSCTNAEYEKKQLNIITLWSGITASVRTMTLCLNVTVALLSTEAVHKYIISYLSSFKREKRKRRYCNLLNLCSRSWKCYLTPLAMCTHKPCVAVNMEVRGFFFPVRLYRLQRPLYILFANWVQFCARLKTYVESVT